MFDEFHQTAKAIFQSAQKEGRLIRNPDNEQLRAFSLEEPEVICTKYDNIAKSFPAFGRLNCLVNMLKAISVGNQLIQLQAPGFVQADQLWDVYAQSRRSHAAGGEHSFTGE